MKRRIVVFLGAIWMLTMVLAGCAMQIPDNQETANTQEEVVISSEAEESSSEIEAESSEIVEQETEKTDPYGLGVSYYEEGQYKVGMDIPAGKYVAWCIDNRYGGYFCVSSDANQDDILFNEIFDVNSLLEIREGEYVEANRCLLIPMDEFYAEYTIKTDITGTMLRVGYDIQAGEYKLQAEEGESGYYCIYGELRQEDILVNDIFEKTTYVTIKEGQYLILHDCTIVQ